MRVEKLCSLVIIWKISSFDEKGTFSAWPRVWLGSQTINKTNSRKSEQEGQSLIEQGPANPLVKYQPESSPNKGRPASRGMAHRPPHPPFVCSKCPWAGHKERREKGRPGLWAPKEEGRAVQPAGVELGLISSFSNLGICWWLSAWRAPRETTGPAVQLKWSPSLLKPKKIQKESPSRSFVSESCLGVLPKLHKYAHIFSSIHLYRCIHTHA